MHSLAVVGRNMIELLSTVQMATFAARGFLRFDGRVPASINERFLADAAGSDSPGTPSVAARPTSMRDNRIPEVPAGTPLMTAYDPNSALGRLVRLPWVRGAIESLVGPGSLIDHHFLHVLFPAPDPDAAPPSQHIHQDSTIDPRMAFDIQLMYFPHAVSAEMGGTRYLPGTHLRVVSEAAIARYQNVAGQQHVVCPAGTLIFTHHGLWHGGGRNRSPQARYLFKTRLNPTRRQQRLWDTSDLTERDFAQRPIFHVKSARDPDHIHTILTTPERWFEQDTGRIEYINRIRFWRFLLGDDSFDADYWVTRIENEPGRTAEAR